MDFDARTALQLGFARQGGIEHTKKKYETNMDQLVKMKEKAYLDKHKEEVDAMQMAYEERIAEEIQMGKKEYNDLKAQHIQNTYEYVNTSKTASPWGIMDERTGVMKLFANYSEVVRELERDADEEEIVKLFLTESDQKKYKASKYTLENQRSILGDSFNKKYAELYARDKLTYRLPSYNTELRGIRIGDKKAGTLKALFRLRDDEFHKPYEPDEFDEFDDLEFSPAASPSASPSASPAAAESSTSYFTSPELQTKLKSLFGITPNRLRY
jgi:hypothetical protein